MMDYSGLEPSNPPPRVTPWFSLHQLSLRLKSFKFDGIKWLAFPIITLVLFLLAIPHSNQVMSNFSFSAAKYPYSSLIIETAHHPLLKIIVAQTLATTPMDWPVQLVTNQSIIDYLAHDPVFEEYKTSGRLIYTQIDKKYLETPFPRNKLMTDYKFWKQVRGEKVLYLGVETVLCAGPSTALSDFLEFDWVGAPWLKPPSRETGDVGSGSVSIRNVNLLLEILRRSKPASGMAEDEFFVTELRKLDARFPPQAQAMKFAVESIFYDAPIAVGKAIKHLKKEDFEKLQVNCPESRMLYPFPKLITPYEIHTEL